jgi:hypothetical protein
MSTEPLLWSLVIAALIAIGLLILLVIGLLRSYGEIVKVLHDAGIRVDGDSGSASVNVATGTMTSTGAMTSNGAEAKPVSGETLSGGAKAITVTGSDDLLLLAFLSSGCGSCIEFWRTLRAKKGRLPGLEAGVVVVTKGPAREEPAKLAELAGDRVEVLMSDQSWDAYDVPLTPHFVLVDRSTGVIIGEGSSADPDSLAGLMARAAADANNVTRRELLTRKRDVP